jgi:hypothetical protein
MKTTNKEYTKIVFKAISSINEKLKDEKMNREKIISNECRKYNLNVKNITKIGGYDRH